MFVVSIPNGSIKSNIISFILSMFSRFQFLMVQLKEAIWLAEYDKVADVSIPNGSIKRPIQTIKVTSYF